MADKETGIPQHINDCPDDKYFNKYVRGKVCAAGAEKWRDLGIVLMGQNAATDLDVIRVDYPHDVKACCSRMFTEWRQTSLEASWKELIDALKEVKLTQLASEVEKLLVPPVECCVEQRSASQRRCLQPSLQLPEEQRYVTDLCVIYGINTAPPDGFTKISVDLNKGAWGEYVYLCYKKGVANPITGLNVCAYKMPLFEIQPATGYTRINSDLNKGAGGDYIYVDYTRDPDLPPIQDVMVIYGDSSEIYPPTQYVKIDTDCNKGTFRRGNFIYICYYQSCQR